MTDDVRREVDKLLAVIREEAEMSLFPGVSTSAYTLAMSFKRLDRLLSSGGGPYPTSWTRKPQEESL